MMPASTPTAVASSTGVPTGVGFHTETESASPGYYGVTMDNKVKVDLTATTRTGMAQATYPDAGSGYFSIDTRLNGNSNRGTEAGKITSDHVSLTVSRLGRVLSGTSVAPAFCTPYGTPYNSPVHFYAEPRPSADPRRRARRQHRPRRGRPAALRPARLGPDPDDAGRDLRGQRGQRRAQPPRRERPERAPSRPAGPPTPPGTRGSTRSRSTVRQTPGRSRPGSATGS